MNRPVGEFDARPSSRQCATMSGSASTPAPQRRLTQKDKKLPPAAAEVEHRGRVPELVRIDRLALANELRGAAHPRLESKVIGLLV